MRRAWQHLCVLAALVGFPCLGVTPIHGQTRSEKVFVVPAPPAVPAPGWAPRTPRVVTTREATVVVPVSGNPVFLGESDWCTTREEAEEAALWSAWGKLTAWMRESDPPLTWNPPLDFVRRMQKGSVAVETRNLNADEGTTAINVYKGRVEIQLSPKQRGEMLRADHRNRVKDRMLLLGGITGGLVGLLLTLAGYIYLDERTKGFYTGRLRLLALGCVAAVGVVLLAVLVD